MAKAVIMCPECHVPLSIPYRKDKVPAPDSRPAKTRGAITQKEKRKTEDKKSAELNNKQKQPEKKQGKAKPLTGEKPGKRRKGSDGTALSTPRKSAKKRKKTKASEPKTNRRLPAKIAPKSGLSFRKPRLDINKDLHVVASDPKIYQLAPLFDNIYRRDKEVYECLQANSGPTELERGCKVLTKEHDLISYMVIYGWMHYRKMMKALENFPVSILNGIKIGVYDWGCGQGIGTLAILDYLRMNRIQDDVSNIWLLDPSEAARNRACHFIQEFDEHIPIHKSSLDFARLGGSPPRSFDTDVDIHIFSCVLDMNLVNISTLARYVMKSSDRKKVFVCVSPRYSNTKNRFKAFKQSINDICGNISLISENYDDFVCHGFNWRQNRETSMTVTHCHQVFMTPYPGDML